MAPPEHRLEDGAIERRKPRQPGYETDAIGDVAALRSGLDDSLVLPHALSQESGSLQEPPPRLDLVEYDIVIFDRQDAGHEEPATEEALAWSPPGGAERNSTQADRANAKDRVLYFKPLDRASGFFIHCLVHLLPYDYRSE